MPKKLSLDKLAVQSFVTLDERARVIKTGQAEQDPPTQPVTCTTMISDLYTACGCPGTWNCTIQARYCW